MKYFKPDLLARCRSEDDRVAEAAAHEWNEAVAVYHARLRTIRAALPRAVRRVLSSVTLHDAKILTIAFARQRPAFTIVVRLEGTSSKPGDVLELSYHLVAGPHGGVSLKKHPAALETASDLGWILYDEFDLDEKRSFFTHSILFTGGRVIEVRFHNLRLRRLEQVYLSPFDLPEGERTWPLSAV